MLAGVAADEYMRVGLLLARGWELMIDDEYHKGRPVRRRRAAAAAHS